MRWKYYVGSQGGAVGRGYRFTYMAWEKDVRMGPGQVSKFESGVYLRRAATRYRIADIKFLSSQCPRITALQERYAERVKSEDPTV